MKEKFAAIFRSQPWFFSGYGLYLIVLGSLVTLFHKHESLRLINGTWTSYQDVFFKYWTHAGDGLMSAFLIASLLFISFRKSIIALLTLGLTSGTTQILKRTLFDDVNRPGLDFWHAFKSGELHVVEGVDPMLHHSFPSGHSTAVFHLCTFIAIAFPNKKVGFLLLIGGILAAYSRVYLGHHYLEDILAGSIIGGLATLILYPLLDAMNWSDKLDRSIPDLFK